MDPIRIAVILSAANIGLHMATAKYTKVCDMKTAAIFSVASQVTQAAFLLLNPPTASTDFWGYTGMQVLGGCLGGSIATAIFGSKELGLKEVGILTIGSTAQAAVYGAAIGLAIGLSVLGSANTFSGNATIV